MLCRDALHVLALLCILLVAALHGWHDAVPLVGSTFCFVVRVRMCVQGRGCSLFVTRLVVVGARGHPAAH